MCSTGDRPESGVPPTGCSCHDRGGQRDRTGRGRPGDILQRLAVYQGRRAEPCGATWQKLGHLRISAGLVRRAIQNYARSEEHTSELQSPYDLVCRLLLEKKKI